MHFFHKSLAIGKAGEAIILKLAADNGFILTATDGRSGDAVDQHGDKFEFKTDSYDMHATGNLFLEWYSNVDKGTPGGPMQALLHDCRYFVYYFSKNKVAFVYDTKDLCDQLQKIDLGKPIYIKNIKWQTLGYKVPRAKLKELMIWSAK